MADKIEYRVNGGWYSVPTPTGGSVMFRGGTPDEMRQDAAESRRRAERLLRNADLLARLADQVETDRAQSGADRKAAAVAKGQATRSRRKAEREALFGHARAIGEVGRP